MPGGYVNPQCPINWQHPLNRGLMVDWTIGPNCGWRGGATLRDLVRGGKKAKDGTLVNAPPWQGNAGCVGSYGALGFTAASSQYVENASFPDVSADITFVARMRSSANASLYRIISVGTNNLLLNFFGQIYIRLIVGGGSQQLAGPTVAVGEWADIVGTRIGATFFTYKNGIQSTTGSAGSAAASSATGSARLGTDGALAEFFSGSIASGRIYNRALTGSEVRQLYQEQRAGCPELWQWLGTKTYFIPEQASPPSSSGLLLRRRRAAA